MANMTLSVKVNNKEIKALADMVDDIISKASTLKNVFGSFGKVDTSSIDKLRLGLTDFDNAIKSSRKNLSSIGKDIDSAQVKQMRDALTQLSKEGNSIKRELSKLGADVDSTKVNELKARLEIINNAAEDAKNSIAQIGADITSTGVDDLKSKIESAVNISEDAKSVISNMGENVDTSGIGGLESSIDAAGQKAEDAKNQISNMGENVDTSGISGLESAIGGAIGVLGGKSLGDMIFGGAMNRETNKVLISTLADTEKQATSLFNAMDDATNKSTVALDALIPGAIGIGKAVGLSSAEIEKSIPKLTAFGAYVDAIPGSSQTAETAIFNLSKAYKGQYATLDQFGVTAESLDRELQKIGKSVKNATFDEFVDGVMAATGAMDFNEKMMKTNSGSFATATKQMGVSARQIGEELMATVGPMLSFWNHLNKISGGMPNKALVIGGGITAVALAAGAAVSMLKGLISPLKSITGLFGSIGKAAPAMGKGAGSMNLMAKYMQIGSMGITQMVVPMLKIAAVVAIALPVAAALAAEAMVLLKLLQMLFKALAFDKIDIGKSVDSIFDLAKGFAGMALAFGALTLVNVANMIYTATGGIIGTVAALTHFKETIAVSIPIINEIANMADINKNVSTKIKQFNAAMAEIVSAVKSMDSVSSAQFSWNPLTNFTKSIEQAKSDIMASVTTINSMGSMANVNTMAVDKIKQISTALSSVAEAVKSMDSVSSAQFNWNPLTNFTTALDQARRDIGHASESLRGYDTLANIPSGASEKIKATSEALKNVATAIKSLDEVSSAQFNWNPLTNFISAMQSARRDIGNASVILAGYNSIANIPEGVGSKIQRVSWTLSNVKTALQGLSNINDFTTEINLAGFVNTIKQVRHQIHYSSIELAALNDIAAIPEGTGSKIQRVGWTLTTVKNALTSLVGLNNYTTNIDLTGFTNTLKTCSTQIKDAAESLRNYKDIAAIPEGTGAKIKAVATTLTNVKTSIESLKKISDYSAEIDMSTFISTLEKCRYQIWDAAASLRKYKDIAAIPEGVGSKIQRVSWTLSNVKTALEGMVSLNNYSVKVDLSKFVSNLEITRHQIHYGSIEVAKFKDIADIDSGVIGKLNSLKNTIAKISEITTIISGFPIITVPTGVSSGIDSLYIINQNLNTKAFTDVTPKVAPINSLKKLIGIISGAISTVTSVPLVAVNNVSSAINTLYTINQNINSKGFTNVNGQVGNINSLKTLAGSVREAVYAINSVPVPQGANVQKAVTTIKQAMDELNKLSGKKLTANISGIATSVKNAISNITSALNQGSGVQPAARNLGTRIVTGLKSGTANLKSVASTAIQAGVSAISGKASAAWTAGSRVGSSAVAGFKSGLNSGSPGDIARIMEKEIGTYVPQLTWRQAPAVAAMMVRVSKEAVKATAKGLNQKSPGDIAKIYKTEVGKYIPMMIRSQIPQVKQALKELGATGTTEVLKGLKISDIFKDIGTFRTVSNYMMNVVSTIQSITKRTVESKTATQQYVQAWIDGANKIKEAESKIRSEITKTNTSLTKLMKTSKTKKKLVFDKKDIALLKLYTTESKKAITNSLKTLSTKIKGATNFSKKQIASIKKQAGAIGKAYKQLNDNNLKNDTTALDKLWKAYKSYYAKLDKAEKKKAKSTIKNIKDQIKEQREAIGAAIKDMNTAVDDIKTSALIEKNLRSITGTEADIKKYSDAILVAQKDYDDYVFNMQSRGNRTDSQWLDYQTKWVNESNRLRSDLEEQQLYLDEAIRKAEEYALAMDGAAESTSALGDTKEDLMALAKAFNNVNKNSVDLNLNMSGMVDLVSKDPKFQNIDTNALQSLFFDFLKKQLS